MAAKRIASKLLTLAVLAASAMAQTRPSIRATGTATVSANPDQVRVNVSVETRGDTAQEATEQNANIVMAVNDRLRQLLGAGADLRTVGYSLNPIMVNRAGQLVLQGFAATNSIQVTSPDLSIGGRIIDTAVSAGANRIGGIQFTIRDSQTLRGQALRAAAVRAREQAGAIAAGLGVRTGAVISADEGSSFVGIPADRVGGAAAATPIEPGLVEVQASVTLVVEIVP